MKVKDGKYMVDVVDAKCPKRPCYQFGFDKGSFTQGRGYTSYHKKQRPVCLRRHIHGCPTNSVCSECRLGSIEDVGAPCERPACDGVTIALEAPPKH